MSVFRKGTYILDWGYRLSDVVCKETDVIRWSFGRFGMSNRLRTDGGADSVIGRVVSSRWFGQTVIWVGDVHVVPWS